MKSVCERQCFLELEVMRYSPNREMKTSSSEYTKHLLFVQQCQFLSQRGAIERLIETIPRPGRKKNADSNSPRCLFFFFFISPLFNIVLSALPSSQRSQKQREWLMAKVTNEPLCVGPSWSKTRVCLSVCHDQPLTCDCFRQTLAGCARQLLADDLSDLAASYTLRSRFRLNIHPLTP